MKSLRSTSAMASQLTKPLTRTRAPTCSIRQHSQHYQQQQIRTFLPNPFGPTTQSLSASRTLPYPSPLLYEIISDVESYNTFLPFCQESTITKFSQPDTDGRKWPEEGKLVIGFNNDISEAFYSRIHCVPGTVVEALSGATETSLAADQIAHHNPRPRHGDDPSRNASVLTHLLTKWTLLPFPYKPGPESGADPRHETSKQPAREQTQVSLNIEYAFANPIYAALSAAAAPKVADKMIAAFEERVRKVVEERKRKTGAAQ
ncbi:hypothetical protein AAFC00_000264 [Neodothiora populina]|uniref:Coenzyme Q-binding protein COQ10 START domain-containing protein n=1 Tax=Neodothiora populina TaxID=2781224 RepID=A0ABR3PDJ1_9PEZI